MSYVKNLDINGVSYEIKSVAANNVNGGNGIKTWVGTKSQYDAISTKDTLTRYTCSDTGEIYLGEVELGKNASFRNIGEIVQSTIPLTDAGLHLLDGALINGSGSYSTFVDYIADLYNNTPAEDVYNVNIVGSLTNNNGVLSGFSSSNYATLPAPFSPSNKNWEIQLKFTTNNSPTTNQQILADGDSSSPFNGVYIVIQNGVFNFGISYNGTAWDLGLINNSVVPVANTEYLLKLSFDGLQYLMQVSTDNGESWVNAGSANSSSTIANTTRKQALGITGYSLISPFNGSIDLNGCYININGQRWWSGKSERRAGFLTEDEWQVVVATYGSCGKYVYDSVNNTVRLPKVSDILQGTTDLTAIGDLVEAGLPNITGTFDFDSDGNNASSKAIHLSGAFTNRMIAPIRTNGSVVQQNQPAGVSFDASRSNSIYGNSSTVQPQTIKVLYYIVIATTTKTDIQIDIDEIATDLNGKADVDLTNVNDSGTSRGASWAMPSNRVVNLSIGASGAQYTMPANGWLFGSSIKWVQVTKFYGTSSQINLQNHTDNSGAYSSIYVPVIKNEKIQFGYTSSPSLVFIYAQGSESEA